ncbi:uncharacterized protein LOC132193430 isoform X2 [Neocloeon triangulifer]|uniref:uncharacterized protein LOC132193430 isoform X2 n=1 Tax=Neocloeon triangulifer TaxID=2078957 RepID=UPI00286EFAEA|nr:uncharacterized protein LOC132193430 isoform X2 [Neocloeon triangulifer]
MKNLIVLKIVIIYFVSLVLETSNFKVLRIKPKQTKQRMIIVQCCGQLSCTQPAKKEANTSRSRTTINLDNKESNADSKFSTATLHTTKVHVSATLNLDIIKGSTQSTLTTNLPSSSITTPIPYFCGDICSGNFTCLKSESKVVAMMSTKSSTADGKFIQSCGQKYFISSLKSTISEAKTACCAYNMRLLKLNSNEQMKCVAGINDEIKQTSVSYWTSGFVDTDCRCWCPDEKNYSMEVENLTWLQTSASNPAADKCITFAMNQDLAKSGLEFANCADQHPFICQSVEITCPSANLYLKNISLFERGKNLIGSSTNGFWENSADSTFLFGNTLMTWYEIWTHCAKFKMTPLSLPTENDLNFVKGLLKDWRYNYNYWTAGTRLDFPEAAPIWCPNREDLTNFDNNKFTGNGNATMIGEFDCVSFQIKKATKNTSNEYLATLNMMNCSRRQLFACKGPKTTNTCVKSVCPIHFLKNSSLFNNVSGNLERADLYGEWQAKCNKVFIFGSPITNRSTVDAKLTWEEARKKCESINFRLITFNSRADFDCLVNVSQKNLGPFWTSGAYFDCPESQKYSWCGATKGDVNLTEMVWGQQGPPEGKVNSCIAGVLDLDKGVQLQTLDCDANISYVCEAMDTKGKSLAEAKSEECKLIFNVSSYLASIFSNLNFSINIRCYIKCMGDSLELVNINGSFVDLQIIKYIEASMESEEQTGNSFDVFEVCKNPNTDLGVCESAAQTFKCAAEKAPDAMIKMVDDAAADMESAPPVGPLQNLCPYNLTNCIPDPVKISQVKSNTPPSGMHYFVTACGAKYILSSEWTDIAGAIQKCCEMGMVSASFISHQQFKCFIDADAALNIQKFGTEYSVGAFSAGNIPIFSWCPTKLKVDDSFKWIKSANYDSDVFQCANLQLGAGGVFEDYLMATPCHADQGRQLQYICMLQ